MRKRLKKKLLKKFYQRRVDTMREAMIEHSGMFRRIAADESWRMVLPTLQTHKAIRVQEAQ